MSGRLLACKYKGPQVECCNHDKKCEEILKSKAALVLFPEYCISYNVIHKIVRGEIEWPEQHALWCLPCQGIPHDDFFEQLKQFENSGVVVIRDSVEDYTRVNFVNALFYCFVVPDDSAGCITGKRLVLLPQLKTTPMSDRKGLCEQDGMSLGQTVFAFGEPTGNCLVTLLCADTMNANLTWSNLANNIANECLGQGLILLNPQLNPEPAHASFAKLRNDIFEEPSRSVYISANWAKGTCVNFTDDEFVEIRHPWSCVYYRHERSYDFSDWQPSHASLLRSNARGLMYGSFIKQGCASKRVSVWYAWPGELVHTMLIQKPYILPVSMQPLHDVKVEECNVWVCEAGWSRVSNTDEIKYRYSLYMECNDSKYKDFDKLAERFSADEAHNYPFVEADKEDADRFF